MRASLSPPASANQPVSAECRPRAVPSPMLDTPKTISPNDSPPLARRSHRHAPLRLSPEHFHPQPFHRKRFHRKRFHRKRSHRHAPLRLSPELFHPQPFHWKLFHRKRFHRQPFHRKLFHGQVLAELLVRYAGSESEQAHDEDVLSVIASMLACTDAQREALGLGNKIDASKLGEMWADFLEMESSH